MCVDWAQVDNPVAVLDQENSKKFLQGNDHDKYAFFMRAADLDRILAVSDSNYGIGALSGDFLLKISKRCS